MKSRKIILAAVFVATNEIASAQMPAPTIEGYVGAAKIAAGLD